MKKVAVVILNWNGQELLRQFLPSVVAHTPGEWADIIVADNGSTDQSLTILREEFPSVQLIPFDKNYGFAGGYNRAIEQIKHPFTVLLNSDVEVTPHWLEEPVRILEEDHTVAGLQPKIRSYRQKEKFEYAGACGGYIDKYGYPFCRGRIFTEVETDYGQYDTPTSILWATGACMLIRTQLYKKAGGLDEYFFAHQEEIDLCWRLRIQGYRFLCLPTSVVYHVGGASLSKENPRKTFLNFRNNLLMLYKNLPGKDLEKTLRIRFWLDYLAACKFLLSGEFKNVSAVYHARKEFYQQINNFKEKRQKIQSGSPAVSIPEILPSSILWNFYAKGRKKFSNLKF